jgi:hypothetical protein
MFQIQSKALDMMLLKRINNNYCTIPYRDHSLSIPIENRFFLSRLLLSKNFSKADFYSE